MTQTGLFINRKGYRGCSSPTRESGRLAAAFLCDGSSRCSKKQSEHQDRGRWGLLAPETLGQLLPKVA